MRKHKANGIYQGDSYKFKKSSKEKDSHAIRKIRGKYK